jgi:Pentapeptide repeats (8 copies)
VEHKTKPGWKPWKPPPEKRDRWERWGLRGKTGWDWLNLLVVPVMLALVAGLFTSVQIIYQTEAETARQQAIADQTAELQRFIEEFRVQEASLQAYLDLMATLLLQHHLREADVSSEARAIAQAQTLTTLRKMDAQGKRTVVLFLADALLLQQTSSLDAHGPVIRLAGADLSEADLSEADLSNADLSRAALQRADLNGAILQGADLRHAALQRANLCPATVPVSPPGHHVRRNPPTPPTLPTRI